MSLNSWTINVTDEWVVTFYKGETVHFGGESRPSPIEAITDVGKIKLEGHWYWFDPWELRFMGNNKAEQFKNCLLNMYESQRNYETSKQEAEAIMRDILSGNA